MLRTLFHSVLNRAKFLAAAFAVLMALQSTLFAQQANEGSETEATQPRTLTIAPYDPLLNRLAEVLGAVHYLRELCGADEGMLWRDKMIEILDAEQPEPDRRARLIGQFNRGYNAYDRIYVSCTPAARIAVDRFVKEGVRLTSQITTRFGR
ncbi:MAG: TIGR02301 family protein [Pseudomonadota bacterium]